MLFFDGVTANNCTKTVFDDGSVKIDRSGTYENVVIVEQPGNRYIGFVATKDKTAANIFSKMKLFFEKNSILLDSLVAVGSDGAAVNVGPDNGIIKHIESYIQRAVHRIICILHLLELILGAVIKYYIGDTKAPNKYKNTISADLENCEKMEIVQFEAIKLNMMPQPIIDDHGDSTFDWTRVTGDQKLLLQLSRAVSCGNVSPELARRTIGEISEIRWTIYACRFLRLYMSSKSPSFCIRRAVEFIQNVYVPILFWIKCYPCWIEGPRHVYKILSFAKGINEETFNIVKERVTFNSHFLHHENMLVTMITDKNKKLREKAYDIILFLRKLDYNLYKSEPSKVW